MKYKRVDIIGQQEEIEGDPEEVIILLEYLKYPSRYDNTVIDDQIVVEYNKDQE